MCQHQDTGRNWLPSENGLLKLTPHCELCGTVKNVTSDKGKRIGYFENALSRLKEELDRRDYRVSQAQLRLVLKEFENKELNDTYWNSFSRQKKEFLDIASKHIRVNKDIIKEYV